MADSYIDVDKAIAKAKEILSRKARVMEEQDIVRTDLRHAKAMGSLTAEQTAFIEEQFPMRKRKTTRKGPNDSAAAGK